MQIAAQQFKLFSFRRFPTPTQQRLRQTEEKKKGFTMNWINNFFCVFHVGSDAKNE